MKFSLEEMAERVGFEPTARCRVTGFQDRLLKPLGHLSIPVDDIISVRKCQVTNQKLASKKEYIYS